VLAARVSPHKRVRVCEQLHGLDQEWQRVLVLGWG
jgi:hypothetical protein